MNTHSKIPLFILLLACIACSSHHRSLPESVQENELVKITVTGEIDTLEWAYQIPRKEQQVLRQMWEDCGAVLEIGVTKNHIYSINLWEIKTKNKWQKLQQLIDQLPELTKLTLHSPEITSIDFKNVPKLKHLSVVADNLNDSLLVMPAYVQHLNYLLIESKQVKQLRFPDAHYKLDTLKLFGCPLKSTHASFEKLKRLKLLWLVVNDQKFNIDFNYLEELWIVSSQITEFKATLPKLQYLYLVASNFVKLEQLPNHLKELRLSGDIVRYSKNYQKIYPHAKVTIQE